MLRTNTWRGPGSGTATSSTRKSDSAGSPGGRRTRTTRRWVFGIVGAFILLPPAGVLAVAASLAPAHRNRNGHSTLRLRERLRPRYAARTKTPASGGTLMSQTMADLAARLEGLLKLRSIPFGMKLFENRADMEAIPK